MENKRERKIELYQRLIAKIEVRMEADKLIIDNTKERLMALEAEAEDDFRKEKEIVIW